MAWQIIMGAEEAGVTVFRPDEGVDTGPIVVQKGGVPIGAHETSASLYFDHLYPLGVEAMADAVAAVAEGRAEFLPQDEDGASFQGLVDDEVARLDWSLGGTELDRRIRGCDPQPGAWAEYEGEPVRFYGGSLEAGVSHGETPGRVLDPDEEGRMRIAAAGETALRITRVRRAEGKKVSAAESGIPVGGLFV